MNEIHNEKWEKTDGRYLINEWDFIVIAVAVKRASNATCSHCPSFKLDERPMVLLNLFGRLGFHFLCRRVVFFGSLDTVKTNLVNHEREYIILGP